jgi:hypothetical protein
MFVWLTAPPKGIVQFCFFFFSPLFGNMIVVRECLDLIIFQSKYILKFNLDYDVKI